MEQHYSETDAVYSPFKRVCRIRKTTFVDGSVETLAQFFDVQDGPRLFRGDGSRIIPAERSPQERAERCLREASRRSRKELRWALIQIGADRMLTTTFRDNVTDYRAARKCWAYFVKLVRAKYPKWQFAVVAERQDRGAVHFHAGVSGFQDVNFLRSCWLRAAGDFGGNVDVAYRKKRWGTKGADWSVRALAGYLSKYLAKAFEWMPKHSQRFTASEDRVRPRVERWWIQHAVDAEIVDSVYRLTCGVRAVGVRQWLDPGGQFYSVSCDAPVHPPVPF